MPNISELYSSAQNASEDDDYGDDDFVTHSTSENGDTGIARVVYSSGRMKENGNTSIIIKGEFETGPHKGRSIWLSQTISAKESASSYNRRVFSALEALGLTGAFFASDPTPQAMGRAVGGNRVRVTVGWQKDKNDPDKFWDRHTLEPVDDTEDLDLGG